MNALEYPVIGEHISVPTEALLINADKRLALLANRQSEAKLQRQARDRQVGSNGETMYEAETRIRRLNRLHLDNDPAEQERRGADERTTASGGRFYRPMPRDEYGTAPRGGI